jgi:DNA polymerase-3 subunit gamma/tau
MPTYLVLARKYRPLTFDEVIGQSHVTQTLKNSILADRVAHAFLFCGVRGVGKTTVARILAKALNCTGRGSDPNPCNACTSCREINDGISVDVQEIDGASYTSVDNIRDINENIKYPPAASQFKIIIIDEVHMISINAFNALLKTLEEPPAHAKFIFATTESHKVPATINSRCQRFNFRTVSVTDMIDGMRSILEREGISAEEDVPAIVAREARGSVRDGLSLLDQVISFGSGELKTADLTAVLGIAGSGAYARLVEAMLDRDAASCLTILHGFFEQGYDPEQIVQDLIGYFRNLIVVQTVPVDRRPTGILDTSPTEAEELESIADKATPEELQNLLNILVKGEGQIKRSGSPEVLLEITVMRMALAPSIVSLREVLKKMEKGPGTGGMVVGSPTTPLPKAHDRTSVKTPRQPVPHKPLGDQRARDRKAPDMPDTESEPSEEAASEPARETGPPPSSDEKQTGDDGFVITDVRPTPEGSPDEIWASLKQQIIEAGDTPYVAALMDHGALISYGPTEVEIGFHKKAYRQQFEEKIKETPGLRQIFEDWFGPANIKILTLAKQTSLENEQPFEQRPDGDTDRNRARKQEALDNPLVKAIQSEFEDTLVEDIKILS